MEPTKQVDLHVMVDLETLGLEPDAVILSIGACTSEPEHIFYEELNPNIQPGRSIDESTREWWRSQANMPYGELSITQAIRRFDKFLRDAAKDRELILWARGIDFDISKLYSMYATAALTPPWKYNKVRDLRTLSKLFPEILAPLNPNKHHALSDARAQMEHLSRILARLYYLKEHAK